MSKPLNPEVTPEKLKAHARAQELIDSIARFVDRSVPSGYSLPTNVLDSFHELRCLVRTHCNGEVEFDENEKTVSLCPTEGCGLLMMFTAVKIKD